MQLTRRAHTWRDSIQEAIAELDRLNQNTEQGFLRIGAKLSDFISAASFISTALTSLAQSISEEHGQRISGALTSALDCSMEMRASHAQRGEGLSGMRQEAGRLKKALLGFQGSVSIFRALGMQTRIEIARLGTEGANFSKLADDMTLLAGNVQARVEKAMDTTALLILPIEEAMRNLSTQNEQQVSDLPLVVAGVLRSLASFHDKQVRARESSLRLQEQYAAISVAFEKLIVSIQFHDITRQQVEHVSEVLRLACLESDRDSLGGGVSYEQRGTAAVLTLQSSQLSDAKEKFVEAAEALAHNLNSIAFRILDMTDESRSLFFTVSDDQENLLFRETEEGCAAILSSLERCAEADAVAQATSSSLKQTISHMGDAISDIRQIAAQMGYMALNAHISALHLGRKGDPLGVLAGSMRERAEEARKRSESLVDALDLLDGAASRLSRAEHSNNGDSDGQNQCLMRIRMAITDLHLAGERSAEQTELIITRGTKLRGEIAMTHQDFSAGSLFAQSVTRVQRILEQVIATNELGSPHASLEGLRGPLADLTRNYTMKSERDLHARMAGRIPPAEPVPGTALDDDVEYF